MTDNTPARSTAYNVLRRIFDEGFSTGSDAVVDEVCSADLLEHQFGRESRGADAIAQVKGAIRDLHDAVPDLRFTIQDWAESGDKIWLRVRAEGTATGPFFGPPSGRRIDLTVMDVARVIDGRIVEHWGVPDRFAMLAQTGVLDRVLG